MQTSTSPSTSTNGSRLARFFALALLLLAAAPSAAILGSFDSNGALRGGAGNYSSAQEWAVPEYLSNPVWLGNTATGLTVSGIHSQAIQVRLAYGTTTALGTTITRCYKDRLVIGASVDADGTCDVPAMERFDFVLCDGGTTDCLNSDTRYHYRLEVSTDSGTTWRERPLASFLTLSGSTSAVQRFAIMSDEHVGQTAAITNCGAGDSDWYSPGTADSFIGPTNARYGLLPQTIQNMVTNNGARQYRAYIGTGDWPMTDHTGVRRKAGGCMVIHGVGSGGCTTTPCPSGEFHGVKNEDEAFGRYMVAIREIQPAIRLMPLFWSLGNHDSEFYHGELHGAAVDNSKDRVWVTTTSSVHEVSQAARLRALPNPAFTYTGTDGAGNTTGQWYSLASGSVEFVVACSECGAGNPTDFTTGDSRGGDLDGDGTSFEVPDDQPGQVNGWDDWEPGTAQCSFLTGASDCTGTTGRLGATSWDSNGATAGGNVLSNTFKVFVKHHTFGSTTNEGSTGRWGGRGAMGAVDRRCVGNGTTQCTIDSDCTGVGSCTLGTEGSSVCCPAYTGTEDLNGSEDEMQRILDAWAAAKGASSYALSMQGHDHNSVVGLKHDGGGATQVLYVSGTQPYGYQTGASWSDEEYFEVSSDWGGLDNSGGTHDGRPDYCDAEAVQASGAIPLPNGTDAHDNCPDGVDGDGIGSILRGYIDLEISGITSLSVRQYSTQTQYYLDEGVTATNNSIPWDVTCSSSGCSEN